MKESGTYRGKTKISKNGNKHIRAVLHMPSMTCVRVNPTLEAISNDRSRLFSLSVFK
jgi:transposase